MDRWVSSDGVIRQTDSATRVRYPRDWNTNSSDDFRVESPGYRSSIDVISLPRLHAGDALGPSAWDAPIEHLEASQDLTAKTASPVAGGRCFVTGETWSGTFAAVLTPRTNEVLVALSEFPAASSLETLNGELLETTLAVLNSVEEVDAPQPA